MTLKLILASQSASRRAMLEAAGVPFAALSASVDEEAAKAGLQALNARDLADALAELKALRVSGREPEALVLGSDSVVALDDGALLDKPESRDQAAEHLRRMSGKRHDLVSAAVIAEGGRPVWRVVDRAKMFVRPLSNKITYISSGPSVSFTCFGPSIIVLYTVTFCPVPNVLSSGQNKPRSVSDGIIFSMPAITICVLGNAQLNLPLPSFSVTATAPISLMMKFAPVTPTSACTYFSRRISRALMVSCSGV